MFDYECDDCWLDCELVCVMNFNEIFYYDETSPSCLRWRIDVYGGRNNSNLRVSKGDPAGSKHKIRGFKVIYQKKSYSVHRIIWQMFFGEIESRLQIDHKNQNSYDNRLENLRIVTNEVNKRNSGKYKNNTSGKTGVRKLAMSGKLYWSATWAGMDYRRISRYFSIEKYGEEQAFKLTCDVRDRAIEELNAQGAGYTDIHGKELAQKL